MLPLSGSGFYSKSKLLTRKIIIMEKLFSYGTLRSKQIQMQIFNKVLTGTADQLLGYKLKSLQIEEEFGMADYVVAIPSENAAETIHGVVFNVTNADLAKVDLFESIRTEEFRLS